MTATQRRALTGAALLVVAACVELGGPKAGVISISNLRLPYPSVVLGDVMRDSLGSPSPLSITAFGPDNQPIPGEPVAFVALDTTVKVDADGTVHGLTIDTLGARIVAGAGTLQTPPQRVIVTIAPTAVTKGPDATISFVNTDTDTSKTTNWSEGLKVTVTGAAGAAAQGYVVVYTVVEAPDAIAGATTPTAYIGDDSARPMPRDTTDTRGVSSRRVILRQGAIATPVRDGTRSDSVIVRATVRYLGTDVPGSPVQFVVPISRKQP